MLKYFENSSDLYSEASLSRTRQLAAAFGVKQWLYSRYEYQIYTNTIDGIRLCCYLDTINGECYTVFKNHCLLECNSETTFGSWGQSFPIETVNLMLLGLSCLDHKSRGLDEFTNNSLSTHEVLEWVLDYENRLSKLGTGGLLGTLDPLQDELPMW